jgi:hypothetical protein
VRAYALFESSPSVSRLFKKKPVPASTFSTAKRGERNDSQKEGRPFLKKAGIFNEAAFFSKGQTSKSASGRRFATVLGFGHAQKTHFGQVQDSQKGTLNRPTDAFLDKSNGVETIRLLYPRPPTKC